MRGLIKLLILSVTIKCVSAFNFTSDDFDETSHHINHESIATISSDYKSDDEETNQNTSEDFSQKPISPPPVSKTPKFSFYQNTVNLEEKPRKYKEPLVDVDELAKKIYWVHSFKVMQLNNPDWSFSNKAKIHPQSVASVIKLPIVNAALKQIKEGTINPRKKLKVVADNIQSYDGEPVGQAYTVTKAIHATLYRSSNTCPNLLAEEMGGLMATRTKLHELGYRNTGYNYLSAKKRTIMPVFKVGSTADDLAKSVYDFYHKYRHVQNTNRRDSAWHAFTNTKYKINVPGAVNTGGKIGTNSISSTYAGIYRIDKIDYIIVTLIDRRSFNMKYKGRINATNGDKALEEANKIIVKTILDANQSSTIKGY